MAASDDVRIELGGTPDDVQGHPWPRRGDGTPLDATAIERAHTVEVSREGSTLLRSGSVATFLTERDGRVERVTLTPLPEARGLDEAVDEATATLRRHGWLDEDLAAQLEELREDLATADADAWPSELGGGLARTEREGTLLEVEIRSTSDGRWFVSVMVADTAARSAGTG